MWAIWNVYSTCIAAEMCHQFEFTVQIDSVYFHLSMKSFHIQAYKFTGIVDCPQVLSWHSILTVYIVCLWDSWWNINTLISIVFEVVILIDIYIPGLWYVFFVPLYLEIHKPVLGALHISNYRYIFLIYLLPPAFSPLPPLFLPPHAFLRPYLNKQGIAYVVFKYLTLEKNFKQVPIILRECRWTSGGNEMRVWPFSQQRISWQSLSSIFFSFSGEKTQVCVLR